MSFNTTTAAHHPTAQELYAHTDFSTLNWVEQQWAAWYLFIGDPVIATGLMSFSNARDCLLWPLHPMDYH